jgi:hypothetical protein
MSGAGEVVALARWTVPWLLATVFQQNMGWEVAGGREALYAKVMAMLREERRSLSNGIFANEASDVAL